MYQKTTLDNGLRVLTAAMPHTRSVSLFLFIGIGSRYEADAEAGISHFTEHLLFRGTPKRPTAMEISAAIGETVLANGFRACYLRPVVFRGSGTFQVDGRNCPTHVSILAIDMGRYLGADALDKGVRAGVSSWRRLAPGTAFASAKIGGQYVNSQFIAMEAHDRGFDEGIALDVSGVVSEGSGENVFLVRNGTLATPPLESSILDGITRRSVLTLASDLGIDVAVEVFPRDRLYLADEAFFTGTAAEITPIVEIDGQRIGDGRPGPITRRLASAFFDIVEGRAPDRHGWLTHV